MSVWGDFILLEWGSFSAFDLFVHETYHSIDHGHGIKEDERRAVTYTNKIRAVFGESLRPSYFTYGLHFEDDPGKVYSKERVNDYSVLASHKSDNNKYMEAVTYSYENRQSGNIVQKYEVGILSPKNRVDIKHFDSLEALEKWWYNTTGNVLKD